MSGKEVVGIDINEDIVNSLNNGIVHIEEPGLDKLVAMLFASGKIIAKKKPEPADVFIIAVPTPIKEDKTANLDYVIEATKSILPCIREGNVVIIESTISPRTTIDIVKPILAASKLKVGEEIYLAHCPERVLPGQIMRELVENDRVIGGVNLRSAQKAAEVYRAFVKGELLLTDATTAEMCKLMENTYRDVNIALANEIVKISNSLGINAHEVISYANRHPRVNIHQPGPGVGGHCLAVDPYFIVEAAPKEAKMIALAREINSSMPQYVVEQVERLVPSDSKVAILGITYKGNIDDTRESPAEHVIDLLIEQGYKVVVHDPHVKEYYHPLFDIEDALNNSDCALILTDHNEFRNLKPDIFNKMRKKIILDTKDCLTGFEGTDISLYKIGHIWSTVDKLALANVG